MTTQTKAKLQQILTDEQTLATTLMVLLIDTYGTEALQWSPETIAMELAEDFEVRLPAANLHRLLTAVSLLTSDDFYKSLPDFIQHCNILAGDIYDPRQWDPADAGEIAWGVTEALLLSPPDEDDEEPFTEEITSYIGEVLEQEGIINPPDILKIATRGRDPAVFIAGEFSDDPLMFDAIYDFETSKTEEINRAVRTGLQKLSQQLEVLPVRSGSTKDVVAQMFRSLG